ncbi:hypothetical protein [Povalibacter sp.]|uniref:hypothetical protein n=1 Tax=Povalibacter sp. TaxID=1962978 RepID=UPI002F425A59
MSASTADTALMPTLKLSEDWTPEGQLGLMLGLCEAQMDSAIQESDQSIDTLVRAFTELVETARAVGSLTSNLPAEVKAQLDPSTQNQLAAFSNQMAAAVVAFQFYDKLSQRLGHVRYSLSTLAQFACSRSQMQQPEQWTRLHSTLRRLYRTQEEREVFQVMMEGDGSGFVHASPAPLSAGTNERAAPGEIELF